MSMNFDEMKKRYAELLVRFGLNVVEGQVVNISTEACNREFALLVVDAAYDAGAKYVGLDLTDPRAGRSRILRSKSSDLEYVPEYLSVKYKGLVDDAAANLKIIGSDYPEILADLDPDRVNKVRLHQHLAIKYFYDEGIGKSKVHWTVAAAATEGWAKKIFPELSAEEAVDTLWKHIFKICRVDQDNFLEKAKENDAMLHERANKMNNLKLESVHFTGPGTDLKVYLSEKALFKGGSDLGPRDVYFEPNVPTEEVFVTPDARKTEGTVSTTRPFLVNGKLIKGLTLEFKEGKVVNFSAEEGEETFKAYISSDPGANRLGELALVGIDSPVYQSGVVFEEILFDENAACHIAVGSAYKFCIDGGPDMSKEELESIGCNESTVHTDMMISSEKVDVVATTYSGEEVALIKKGNWVI